MLDKDGIEGISSRKDFFVDYRMRILGHFFIVVMWKMVG